MKRRLIILWGLAVWMVLLVTAGIAQGRTITVGQGGGYDFTTIQAAIDNANNGDTILVADGIYYGNGNRDIDFKGKAITVRSENGPAMCIIDCQGSTGDPHRGFYFHSNEDSNSVLDGLTIRNGYASSASPEQKEWSGGGILCYRGNATIRNCIIMGNTTRNGTGGGIKAFDRTVITGCIIKGNYAIGLQEFGPGGAGISCGGSTTVSNCIIFGNTAVGDGGGILCTSGNPTIINCTITGNLAAGGGGIGCKWWANALIRNCTVSGNLADSHGGGISCLDSGPTLVNCIFWGNSSKRGPEIASFGIYGPFSITVSYSDVQGGQADAYVTGISTLIWGNGNITADPCFADSNNGDYHLKSQAGCWDADEGRWTKDEVTSPCIDAGDPSSPIGYEPFPNGGIINMGAYGGTAEASKSYFGKPVCETIVAGDINGDCIVNLVDFAFMAFHWLEDNTLVNSNSVVKDGIEYWIQTNKAIYRLGEDVEILYRVTNVSENPIDIAGVLNCAYAWSHFVITDRNGTEIWEYIRVIPPCGWRTLHLDPYESKEYQKIWSMVNDNGTFNKEDDFPVGPGSYNITGELELDGGHERVPVSVSIEIKE